MTIGEKIRIARHLRGYTQAELGSMVKLPGDMIRKYENDVRTPKPERLSLIAQKFELEITLPYGYEEILIWKTNLIFLCRHT